MTMVHLILADKSDSMWTVALGNHWELLWRSTCLNVLFDRPDNLGLCVEIHKTAGAWGDITYTAEDLCHNRASAALKCNNNEAKVYILLHIILGLQHPDTTW
jgi:hypothetical protein